MRNDVQIDSPPRTTMEVFRRLPIGTLAEVVDTILYVWSTPALEHQKILQQVAIFLTNSLKSTGAAELIIGPFDVYLDEISNAVQPDIVVVLKENLAILNEEGHIHGVPDLLVEVLSPGNTDHDRVRKKNLYEKFGVKEYWIVDPDTKTASVFSLQNKVYHLHFEGVGSIQSELLKQSFQF